MFQGPEVVLVRLTLTWEYVAKSHLDRLMTSTEMLFKGKRGIGIERI